MSTDQSFEDKLAIQLMECAILVKKGDRSNPVVKDTLEKLHLFCQAETTTEIGARAVSPTGSAKEKMHHGGDKVATTTASSSGGPVLKPLGNVFGKMMGMGSDETKKTAEQKKATSEKNAARAKADLAADMNSAEHHHHGSWLPFLHSSEDKAKKEASTASQSSKPRPEFQRPSNPKSALIANGWIEQQRRSKMRTVWKDVLASLVEARKPGEETTLWIQRQITNSSGKAELEALHQIPVKWLQDVSFLDYSVDNRFTLRVYNLDEDFVFRCPKDPSAAENWVMTLLSAKEAAIRKKTNTLGDVHREPHRDEKKSAEPSRAAMEAKQVPSPSSGPVPSPSAPPPAAAAPPRPSAPQQAAVAPPESQNATKKKVSIKELRALAHGAGINTHGMERGELERVVEELSQQHQATATTTQPRPAAPQAPPDTQEAAHAEAERKRQEEEHQRVMAARVHAQQEALRKQKEDEERQRLARERQMREEEELRKRLAKQQAEKRQHEQEEAARREQEEFRRRQEAWQKQQAEQESRRAAEQQRQQEEERRRAAEQQRQHEAYQRNMHWQQPQAPSSGPPPQHPQWQQHNQPQQQQFPFPGYAQQQQQQQPHPPNGFYNQQQQQQAQAQQSKYAKMAAQEDDSSATQRIKHAILIHWALQPPMRQNLRRIEDLVTSIHTVFPPAFGVPGHDYFQKWSALTPADVNNDDKLEKKVKKLRFFLHPDKLPKDLSGDQSFMCRMLWDITSDALEEHKTKKEDLSWIHH